jgi:hypothetical protein
MLSLHVLAAIVLIGPITVAVSVFPRFARAVLADPDSSDRGALRFAHRISTAYSILAIAVPVLGIATAVAIDAAGEMWIAVSIVITIAAAAVLAVLIIPSQRTVMAALDGASVDGATAAEPESLDRRLRGLSMQAGVFGLLWATVVVLMVVRPGSTTGV